MVATTLVNVSSRAEIIAHMLKMDICPSCESKVALVGTTGPDDLPRYDYVCQLGHYVSYGNVQVSSVFKKVPVNGWQWIQDAAGEWKAGICNLKQVGVGLYKRHNKALPYQEA